MGVADRRAYRDDLMAAGLLVGTGVDGVYGRSGAFETVVGALERLLEIVGAEKDYEVLRFPPVMARPVFERSDYLRSFPQLVGSVHTFAGDEAAHLAALAALDVGADWTASFVPTEVVLCSAACHPLYPGLAGRQPAGGRLFDVCGWVFRCEPSTDPGRMQAFRQYEHVYVGDPETALAHRDAWVERGLEMLASLGLKARTEVANDPFFGRAGRLLSASQRADTLKYELVCDIGPGDGSRAVVSSNCHKDHFGEAFGIVTNLGDVAHSACVGFGLERITLALFHAHGLDAARWPAEVRAFLWP